MQSEQRVSKTGGVSAIAGAVVLMVATWLHPLDAHPQDALAAFAEYAADRFWVASHLGQLAGVVLISAGLLGLAWRLRQGQGGMWASLGAVGVVVSLAIGGVLQAVDGIALKVMVDRLASAAPEAQPAIFEAAFAVRQIEIGLGSVMAVFLGLAAVCYGLAQRSDAATPNWLGWLAIASGAATFAAGIVQAHLGFADATMAVSMPGSILLSLWVILAGLHLLRGRAKVGPGAPRQDAA
jgi:hypothetical protein